MARYDGIRYGQQGDTFSSESIDEYIRTTRSGGLGSEVQQRILTGTYVLNSEHYDGYVLQAQRVRHLLRQQVE
jgi:aspartyl-tRNA(Asn)/glutamyl-tRNA(Gln) amidotransferase subunit A